jgi:hypothetical protein
VAEQLDWTVAAGDLQRTIAAAVRLKRARALQGRLHELVGTDWAITTQGIENIKHPGFLVPGLTVPARKQDRQTWQPERPDWATDDEQWRRVVERAREYFPESTLEQARRWLPRDRRTWYPWVEEAA